MSQTTKEDSTPSAKPRAEVKTAASTRPPVAPVGLLYRMFDRDENGGAALTAEEQAEWKEHVGAVQKYEQRRDLLALVDLADVIENGVGEPEMLTESLVRSEHHVVFGARESAKTWLVLRDAVELIVRGEGVIWVDKEMGRRNIADRLITLGAKADDVREHFVYMEFPSMDCSSDSKVAWRALLEEREPSLVVVDAQTEVLADAGLNENSGTDVEKWSQAYVTPARRIEAATVMIDHTGHSESGRPVASRQKGAAAKVELSVTKDAKFGRETVGGFTVEVTKNTVSARIPWKRSWRIGGDDGKFVFEPSTPQTDPAAAAKVERAHRIEKDIVSVLGEHEEPLSQNQLANMVEGSKKDVTDAAKRLGLSELSRVQQVPGPNRSLLYSIASE